MARTSAYVEELSKSFATSLNAATESPALLLAFVARDSYTIITPVMAFRRMGLDDDPSLPHTLRFVSLVANSVFFTSTDFIHSFSKKQI